MIVGVDDDGWVRVPLQASENIKTLALAALSKLSPRRASDYDQIRVIGRMLHGASPELFDSWKAWASSHPAYTPERCAECWASFAKNTVTPVGIGLLIAFARRDSNDRTFGKGGP